VAFNGQTQVAFATEDMMPRANFQEVLVLSNVEPPNNNSE